MSSLAAEWSASYAEVKAMLQSRRATASKATEGDVAQVQSRVQQLASKLRTLSAAPVEHEIAASELGRRQVLVDNLKKQIERLQVEMLTARAPSGAGTQVSLPPPPATTAVAATAAAPRSKQQVIQMQDELITDIGAGVDRLRMSALQINDEASLHARLLDDFETDVTMATTALQAEATRASAIKERTSLFRLYLCLAVEAFVLLVMLFAWATRG